MGRDESRGVWLLAVGQTAGYRSDRLCLRRDPPVARGGQWLAPGGTRARTHTRAPDAGRTGAVLGPPGRPRLGGALLGGAAALGGLCLLALSQVGQIALWYLLWIVIGVAQAASLYETCFSFLTRRLGPFARDAIIRVTLVAGFASTFAFPLGAWAGAAFGWRGALLVFAAVQIVVTVPANLLGVRYLRRGERRGGPMVPTPRGAGPPRAGPAGVLGACRLLRSPHG